MLRTHEAGTLRKTDVGSTVTLATDPSCNDLDVSRITRATLTFDDQKNAVRGEQISHAATAETLLKNPRAVIKMSGNVIKGICAVNFGFSGTK